MIELLIVGAASFAAGFVSGATLRGAIEYARQGHTGGMASLANLDRLTSGPTGRRVGIVLVALALAANAAVGFLSITTRTGQADLVTCIARYNALSGAARDERTASSEVERASRERLFRTIRAELRDPAMTPADVDRAITTYLLELRKLDRVAVANPYPAADLCVEK